MSGTDGASSEHKSHTLTQFDRPQSHNHRVCQRIANRIYTRRERDRPQYAVRPFAPADHLVMAAVAVVVAPDCDFADALRLNPNRFRFHFHCMIHRHYRCHCHCHSICCFAVAVSDRVRAARVVATLYSDLKKTPSLSRDLMSRRTTMNWSSIAADWNACDHDHDRANDSDSDLDWQTTSLHDRDTNNKRSETRLGQCRF